MLTGATNFYFNMGHTIGAICRLLNGNRGIYALKPVVRGPRLISRLSRENIEVMDSPSRTESNRALMVHSRKMRRSIVSCYVGGGVGCISTAYAFISGVRGVMDSGDHRNCIMVITNSVGRRRMGNVMNRDINRAFIMGDISRLSALLRGGNGFIRGTMVLISRAAFGGGI